MKYAYRIWLEVNTKIIRDTIVVLQLYLQEDVKFLVVVKADECWR